MELRKPHLKMIFFMALVSCFFAPLFSSYTLIPHEQKLDDLFPVLSQAETAHIKLPNQLEALLISLPQASRSHMTMTVSAGSWQNPEHALGMAHLIEHLVIQNNKSDDSSDSFTKWVTKKGGSFDAYTNFSLTSYAFTLPNQDLPEGINQFSQALAHPDWSHENIQKEILVIEQEYQLQKNKNEQFYCLQAVANQHHPFSRFKSGNKQTLSSIDTADCVDWYHHHYDPIKMHMVIISPFPLETLMDLTQTHFSGLIHHKQPSPLPKTPLFTPLKNGNFLCIKSKRNVSELSLIWEIPASLMNGDHTPAALLKTVINSSGKHSLIDALKELDLATSLKADTTQFSPSYAIIEIKYELTDKGIAHPHDVAKKNISIDHISYRCA
ncbi:MAG: insulinase family protein [Candidatus Rhabdochlamydia sp.]